MGITPYRCDSIRPGDVRPAYPLIRNALPGLSLDEWVAFARRSFRQRQRGKTGILVARGGQPYPVGLCCWRQEVELARGSVLRAHQFVAFELRETRPVTMALLDGLDQLAREIGCDRVESVLHDPAAALASRFQAAGHRPAGAIWEKRIVCGPDRVVHTLASALSDRDTL